MSYLAADLTSVVNASAIAGGGWGSAGKLFGTVPLRRYSWLEYYWGSVLLPGALRTGEMAPLLTVSLSRQDHQSPVRTLQGPTGWVQHEPGEYAVRVLAEPRDENAVDPRRPMVTLVTSDERPAVSWTSEGLAAANNPPQLIPPQAKWVFGHINALPTVGLLIQWFQGQNPRFSVATIRLRVDGKGRVPDGATHYAQITANTAFSFE